MRSPTEQAVKTPPQRRARSDVSWPSTLIGAARNFAGHQMTDHAAALTYFMMMSLFPALLACVSLLGVFGSAELIADAVSYARDAGADPTAVDAIQQSLRSAIDSSGGTVSVALIAGLAGSLYGASGAFGAAGRALNVVFGVDDDRGLVKGKLTQVGWTLLLLILAAVALSCVLLGGQVARDVFDLIGLGGTAATVWAYGRWLVAFCAAAAIFGVIYGYAPDVQRRRMRWLSPGAACAVILWLAASAALFFYVKNFGSYNATYGAFASAVVLLLWLYVTALCMLFGAELNAERERREAIGPGAPPPAAEDHPAAQERDLTAR